MSKGVSRFRGDNLLEARLGKGWSTRDAARKCGLTGMQIWKLERGESKPTVKTLSRLVAGFGLPASALVDLPRDEAMLHEIREIRMLSRPEVASYMGVSTDTLRNLEDGMRPLRPEETKKLARKYAASEEYVEECARRSRNR